MELFDIARIALKSGILLLLLVLLFRFKKYLRQLIFKQSGSEGYV